MNLIVRFQKLSNYGKYFCEIDRVHHGIYVVRIIKTVPEKDKEQFEAVTSAVMEALVHSNSIRMHDCMILNTIKIRYLLIEHWFCF